MNCHHVRTDLALEARESVLKPEEELRGVRVEEDYDEEKEIRTTRVMIETRNGSRMLGKPMGTYITLEASRMTESDEDYHREISEKLAEQLVRLLPETQGELSVLVVGLGNRDVTADSLGPLAVDNLMITRHVLKEFGQAAYHREQVNRISSIVPGVMAKTGMETAEIVRGIVEETSPDVIIVIDALAARSTKRLNRTIQLTDSGIHPGSGVGNHRNALTKESLGIPVIAIGVPTVVDAATIVNDAIEKYKTLDGIDVNHELNNMYVTGKDIDEIVKRVGYTLSEAVNIALTGIGTE